MARTKRTLTQADMGFMEVREDFLEAHDLELRGQSLRRARNVRALATRAVEARPGLWFERLAPGYEDVVEIRPASGLVFGLILKNGGIEIIEDTGNVVWTLNVVPWSDAGEVYVAPFRERTVIGGAWGIRVLTYEAGNWSLDPWEFATVAGGDLAQPYWVHVAGVPVQPSARTGSITLTAAEPIWTTDYVGQRVRWHGREVLITSFLSATVLVGTVLKTLLPAFNVTVADGGKFRVGEVVVGQDTGYAGVITARSGNVLTIATTEFEDGPDLSEEISGTSGSSTVNAKALTALPFSTIWDEPLMSPLRGYPRSAAAVAGRLVLVDFPAVPDLVAISSARAIEDFDVGLSDADAIVRQSGDNAPRFLHAVNAGDLLLLADQGCYLVPNRDNGVITPATFNLVRFDDRGASPVRPKRVDDGVVFVDASGEGISAALLGATNYGNLKWSVRSLSIFHDHLIRSPTKLCGPALSSPLAEKYLIVVNADGTLAVASWSESFGDERIGFALWDTDGAFVAVSPVFAGYWAIVDRDGTRMLERFGTDAMLDACVTVTSATTIETLEVNGEPLLVNGEMLVVRDAPLEHLAERTVAIGGPDFYAGDFAVAADGTVTGEPALTGARQIGLRFTARVEPWPRRIIESPRDGMMAVRIMRFACVVQDTALFAVRTNRTTRNVGGYSFGDDLSENPALRTKRFEFPIFGTRDHPEIEIIKDKPGRFRLLSMTQEVQG